LKTKIDVNRTKLYEKKFIDVNLNCIEFRYFFSKYVNLRSKHLQTKKILFGGGEQVQTSKTESIKWHEHGSLLFFLRSLFASIITLCFG